MKRFLNRWPEENRPIIIAEIGVNHNGDVTLAKQMIDSAKDSGADIVKFQTFITDRLVGRNVGLAEYQSRNLGQQISQYEMIRALELSRVDMSELREYCQQSGVMFLSSVGDVDSVDFLCKTGVDAIKIGSSNLTNLPFLRYVAKTGRSVLLSTGMGTLGEVEAAVMALEEANCDDIILFHCTSNYPTPYDEVNLRAMNTLRAAFQLPVGYSDHTLGYEVALGATALGAVAIEKHFTLDRSLPGPDHRASMTPDEFHAMVESIKNLSSALGVARKMPTGSELMMRNKVRKSLVANQLIPEGSLIEPDMLSAMRVGSGLAPAFEEIIVGARAKRSIMPGEPLSLDMFDFSGKDSSL